MSVSTSRLALLDEELDKLRGEGRLLSLRVLEGAQDPVAIVDGRTVVNLASNNYLSFTGDPAIKKAAIEAIERYGTGTAAVRTIIGTMDIHQRLEERLARFKGTEAALVFQSGFATNVALCQSLMSSDQDLLVSDESNHASIIDGARLAKSPRKIYPHRDMKALRAILESPEARKARRRMIVSDGVFSMDGDIAPLPEIVELAENHDAFVMVDDAHASGVLGRNGRGTPDHFGLSSRIAVQIGTLSKAIGAIGGYVAGCRSLRDYLISTARPFLFSSSHPPSVTATCLAALDALENEPQRTEKLWSNARLFKAGLKELGFDTGISETPITPVMVGDGAKARALSQGLFEEGVFALAIGFPSVPKGRERLRTIVTAGHSEADLRLALEKFRKVGRSLGLVG